MKLFKKSQLDEREKMEFYKAEHYGYYVMFFVVFAEVVIESYILNMSFRETIGELILLMAGSVTLIFNAVKHGNWDYIWKPNMKTYFWCSFVASLFFTLIFVFGKMRQFESVREDLWGHALPIGIFIFVSFFILCFAALALTGEMAKKRKKKLEEEFDDKNNDEK